MDRYVKGKYDTNIDGINNTLEKYGIAVIPALLDEIEQKAMVDGMWDFLREVTSEFKNPIDRTQPDSWKQIK